MIRPRVVAALAALCAGFGLYWAVIVVIGGVLAAIAIPASYFQWFGRENLEGALALMNVATWALPVTALVAAGTVAMLVLARRFWPVAAVAWSAGMVGACLWWQTELELSSAKGAGPESSHPRHATPWYSTPNLAAPWVGLALGLLAGSSIRRKAPDAGVV